MHSSCTLPLPVMTSKQVAQGPPDDVELPVEVDDVVAGVSRLAHSGTPSQLLSMHSPHAPATPFPAQNPSAHASAQGPAPQAHSWRLATKVAEEGGPSSVQAASCGSELSAK